jgi:hypothetical protein
MAFQVVLAAREDYSQVLLLSEHLVISAAAEAVEVLMTKTMAVTVE